MSDKGDIQDRISRRAHEIWEREGHPHGRHDEHWAQAEAEIRAEDGAKPAVTPPGAGDRAQGGRQEHPRRRRGSVVRRVRRLHPRRAQGDGQGGLQAGQVR
ncbi:DUF2934 domain-containing protein [Azospirillum doebereinerae]|uniref:DUF2934 domain-containing protein n=1 Tax=Azospirillum doebereinerae TaxID=92933 RepID=UPI0038502933